MHPLPFRMSRLHVDVLVSFVYRTSRVSPPAFRVQALCHTATAIVNCYPACDRERGALLARGAAGSAVLQGGQAVNTAPEGRDAEPAKGAGSSAAPGGVTATPPTLQLEIEYQEALDPCE